jgi:hypothetical protein
MYPIIICSLKKSKISNKSQQARKPNFLYLETEKQTEQLFSSADLPAASSFFRSLAV